MKERRWQAQLEIVKSSLMCRQMARFEGATVVTESGMRLVQGVMMNNWCGPLYREIWIVVSLVSSSTAVLEMRKMEEISTFWLSVPHNTSALRTPLAHRDGRRRSFPGRNVSNGTTQKAR